MNHLFHNVARIAAALLFALTLLVARSAAAADSDGGRDLAGQVAALDQKVAALDQALRGDAANAALLGAQKAELERQVAALKKQLADKVAADCRRGSKPCDGATPAKAPPPPPICDEDSGAVKQGSDCVCPVFVDDGYDAPDPKTSTTPMPYWDKGRLHKKCVSSWMVVNDLRKHIRDLKDQATNAASKAELARLEARLNQLHNKVDKTEFNQFVQSLTGPDGELTKLQNRVSKLENTVNAHDNQLRNIEQRLLALTLGLDCTGQYRGAGMGGLYACGVEVGFRTNPTGDGAFARGAAGLGQYAAFQDTPTITGSLTAGYEWRVASWVQLGVGAQINASGSLNAPSIPKIKNEDRRSLLGGAVGSVRIGNDTVGLRLDIGGLGGRSTFTRQNGSLGDASVGTPVSTLALDLRL